LRTYPVGDRADVTSAMSSLVSAASSVFSAQIAASRRSVSWGLGVVVAREAVHPAAGSRMPQSSR
jgi:hypothetical protein